MQLFRQPPRVGRQPRQLREAAPRPRQQLEIHQSRLELRFRQKFPAGTLLTVELQNWAGDVSRTLQTRVVHMTPHPEGGWIMGCAFVTPLNEEELKALL